MNLGGKTGVVTGAGGGIGRAVSQLLAAKGCHLGLVDINEQRLAETRDVIRAPVGRVSVHPCDIGRAGDARDLAGGVLAHHGAVQILVNCAGVSLGGDFARHSMEDAEWLMNANFWGVVRTCHAFLPGLLQESEAHIVNVASVMSFVSVGTKAMYCASKFAIRGFSAALDAELRGTRVRITTVCPGAVRTRLVENGRDVNPERQKVEAALLQKWGVPPERVARKIARVIETRRSGCVTVGADAAMVRVLSRLFPGSAPRLVSRLMR